MEKSFSNPEFNLLPVVEERIQYLEHIKEKLEEEYQKMPEGSILVAPGSSENSFRYYLRKTPQEKMGTYLDASKNRIKKQYCYKKYYAATIKEVKEEIKNLEKIKKMKVHDSIVGVYGKLNEGIKKLIKPINVDDKTYVKMWMSKAYDGLGFDPNDKTEYYSDRGERMRSKSELLIANSLIRRGIPYKYECPVETGDGRTFYPDFTILDVKHRRVKYCEHLGRMSDLSYVSKNIWKLDEYKKINILLGINLFLTYENEMNAIRTSDIENTINAILL